MTSANWERTPGLPRLAMGRELTESLDMLSEASKEFFDKAYEIPPLSAEAYIYEARSSGRYALPIRGYRGPDRGYVLRMPWGGAPLKCRHPYKKADTYKTIASAPLQSHYAGQPQLAEGNGYGGSTHFLPAKEVLVVVEDQLSAIKLAAHGYDSVALCGVPDFGSDYSGADRVRELAKRAAGNEVLIALDPDATELAFRFAKKWGHAFRAVRVVMLERDLKDEPTYNFYGVLGA